MMRSNAVAKIKRDASVIRQPKLRKRYRDMLILADDHARTAGALRKAAATLLRQAHGIRYQLQVRK